MALSPDLQATLGWPAPKATVLSHREKVQTEGKLKTSPLQGHAEANMDIRDTAVGHCKCIKPHPYPALPKVPEVSRRRSPLPRKLHNTQGAWNAMRSSLSERYTKRLKNHQNHLAINLQQSTTDNSQTLRRLQRKRLKPLEMPKCWEWWPHGMLSYAKAENKILPLAHVLWLSHHLC